MEITSRTNPRVTAAAKLRSKKERDERGLFVFEGLKLFCEAKKRGVGLKEIYVTDTAAKAVGDLLPVEGCEVFSVTPSVYEKLTDDRTPDGIFCVAPFLSDLHGGSDIQKKAMILCDVQDAGNLGTCLRSALAFGIDTLILTGCCADVYNAKCVRASMGAVFSQRTVRFAHPLDAVAACKEKGYRVYAAALRRDAVPLDDFSPGPDCVFAVGNEGHGLSSDFVEACDGCVIIPMKGDTESLNAAVASSLLMWEMRNKG